MVEMNETDSGFETDSFPKAEKIKPSKSKDVIPVQKMVQKTVQKMVQKVRPQPVEPPKLILGNTFKYYSKHTNKRRSQYYYNKKTIPILLEHVNLLTK